MTKLSNRLYLYLLAVPPIVFALAWEGLIIWVLPRLGFRESSIFEIPLWALIAGSFLLLSLNPVWIYLDNKRRSTTEASHYSFYLPGLIGAVTFLPVLIGYILPNLLTNGAPEIYYLVPDPIILLGLLNPVYVGLTGLLYTSIRLTGKENGWSRGRLLKAWAVIILAVLVIPAFVYVPQFLPKEWTQGPPEAPNGCPSLNHTVIPVAPDHKDDIDQSSWEDPLGYHVQPGINVDFDPRSSTLTATLISVQADCFNVTFFGWGSSGKVQLRSVGEQAILTPNHLGVYSSQNGSRCHLNDRRVYHVPESYPGEGDAVKVTAVGVSQQKGRAIFLTKENKMITSASGSPEIENSSYPACDN